MSTAMQITRLTIALFAFGALCITDINAIVVDETQAKQINQICPKGNTTFLTCQSSTRPTCANPNPQVVSTDCNNGCYCENGHVLNSKDECILLEDCPGKQCPQNQTYKDLAQVCRKNCETQYLTLAYACAPQPGCECNEGFIDDKQGNCILPQDCNPKIVKCPPNKFYNKCQVPDATCDNYGTPQLYKRCQPGCFCSPGLILNNKGECIPPKKCPSVPRCPANETWKECSLCGHSCGTYYLNIAFKCACKPGCACKEGYIRNALDQCIKVVDCTKEETRCQDEQHFCDSEVRKTCQNPKGSGLTSGCFCNEGLVYDEDRKMCVDPGECENSKENRECHKGDPNTQFMTCQPGNIATCSGNIVSTSVCSRGCYCKPGFLYNAMGKCVSNCDENCPANSTYSNCASNCGNNCKQMLRNDIACILMCTPGCTCNPGLVWNSQGQCVDKHKCNPKEIECPARQKFSECNRNIVRTCQDKRVAKVRDIELVECNWGCFCEDPFIWNAETDQCIYPAECPASNENQKCAANDPNSEYKVCQSSSTRRTCNRPNPTVITDDCVSECRCKIGFYLNEDTKKCVTLNECDIKLASSTSCPKNSTFSTCASACPKTCANAYLPGNKRCMACYEGCECEPGFLKSNTKGCVLSRDCPETEILCPYDRVYKSCEHGIKTCYNPQNDTIKECLRGCFCGNNMVENEEGRCVNINECADSPQNIRCRSDDKHSHFLNCKYVRETCSDPTGEKRKDKCLKGCFCNDGFVLDKRIGRCVKLQNCSIN